MSLEKHRIKENLGGLVYLLTVDMRHITGDPTHIRRFVNNYGENGVGVEYQGNKYQPYPYQLQKVTRSSKNNSKGATIEIGDGANYNFSRFIDLVGGNLQEAKVLELKVYGRFLDSSPDSDPLAYVKVLDHIVDYTEDSGRDSEIVIHTIDPLSKALEVPTLAFTSGVPNSQESRINIFPAVDRNISRERG